MNREKWRSFILAFVLTAGALATVMVVTVMAVQPSLNRGQAFEAAPEQDSYAYRPRANDSLTLVVIGVSGESALSSSSQEISAASAESGGETLVASTAGGQRGNRATATDFLLIRFNPQYGQVPLTLLPPQSAVTLEGVSLTLEQAYQKGGGVAVKSALSERLGIAVDRYASISRGHFIRLAEKTGSVTFRLPYRIEYTRGGYDVSIPQGDRRLDGRDIADLFEYPGFSSDGVEKSALLGELTAAIVNQNLDAASETRSSGLFRFAVNLLDTDITSADYEVRRRAADFMSSLGVSVAGNLPIAGSTPVDGGSFELSEGYVELVRGYFQPTK